MAEEKGRVLLFGRRWSGRTTFANMLARGEIRDRPLNPADMDNICKTYVGRGWTVIDTMGFGEPLDDIAKDEFAIEMGITFLNEVRGSYSHLIFVLDGQSYGSSHYKHTLSMWKTFIDIFKGGEERFVILVTKLTSTYVVEQMEEEFPECKHFLYSNFFNVDFEGEVVVPKEEALHKLEKEMKEMWKDMPWVEPNVTNMEEEEIKEMAAIITHQLTSILVDDPEWKMDDESTYPVLFNRSGQTLLHTSKKKNFKDTVKTFLHVRGCTNTEEDKKMNKSENLQPVVVDDLEWKMDDEPMEETDSFQSLDSSEKETLEGKVETIVEDFDEKKKNLDKKVQTILYIRDEMEYLGKKVKFYPRQCEYLLKRTKDVAKEIHDVINGNEMNWDEDQCLETLIKFLSRIVSHMAVANKFLHLFGEGVEKQVILAMSFWTESGRKSFSKFALVLRNLAWSLDLFMFWWHIVRAEGFTKSKWASWVSEFLRPNAPKLLHTTQGERQSWRSQFSWSEAQCRLVYVGNDENGFARTQFLEPGVLGDNERHAQDQQDLISSLESHFRKPKKIRKWHRFFHLISREWKMEDLSDSENLNYMSILKNRLQGDLPLQGDLTFQEPSHSSSSSIVPRCFQIPGHQEYKSIQLIGEGSFKEVFRSKWLGMNVALATSKSGHQGQTPSTNLEAEAEMLARVQHPNVVTLIGYAYDKKKQQGFLVTELLGPSLEALIKKAMYNPWSLKRKYPFSILEAIAILLQIVEAMIHVHECGVMYGDLKPENCLSTHGDGSGSYVVKLIDLGSAKMGSEFKTPNVGTLPYMAPEVYGPAGDPEGSLYSLSADVYSFGMTCYQIITGNQPFRNMTRSQLRKKVCDGVCPIIPSNCPNELRELMIDCWAHVAEDRPTFKDIQQRLWNFKLDYSIWD